MEKKAFSARMSEVFKRPGQDFKSFMEEFRALTTEDKMWYCRELNAAGFPTENWMVRK